MDPFLKMQCQGEKLNTEEFMYLGKAVHRRRETVDPMWYFTWEADLSLPPLELQRYFPQVQAYLYRFVLLGDPGLVPSLPCVCVHQWCVLVVPAA